MSVIRSPLRSPIYSPVYDPLAGKWAAGSESEADASYSSVAMLLDCSVLSNGTGFVDTGPSAHTLTAVNQATISGGALVCASGGNDYVSAPADIAWLLNGKFCIEVWNIKFSETNTNEHRICGPYDSSSNQRGWVLRWGSSGNLELVLSTEGTSSSTTAINLGAWSPSLDTPYYIRISRDASNVIRAHIDGELLAAGVTNSGRSHNTPAAMAVGGTVDPFETALGLRGQLTAFRMTNNDDRGTTDDSFTPPSLPLSTEGPASDNPDAYYNGVAVLLDCSVLSDGTGFVDTGPAARTLTAVNQATISSGVLVCAAGGNDYVTVPDEMFWRLAGEFCIEVWGLEFSEDNTTEHRIAGQYNSSGGNRGWILRWGSSGNLELVYSTAGTTASVVNLGAWSPSLDTPYYVCVSRDASNVIRGHIGGTLLAAGTTNSFTSFNSDAAMAVGGTVDSLETALGLRGQLTAFRMTLDSRGTSDSSFTPPSLPLPTSA